MTLPIHDQGGLTEAEIELKIAESAERRESALETKLESHRLEIKADIDRNNDRLVDMQGAISAITAENKAQTEKLDGILRKGDEWHESDLKFRSEMLDRVGAVEGKTTALTESVARLHYVGLICFGAGRVIGFACSKLKEADVWKVIATVVALYILHLVSPSLAHLLKGLVSK